MTSFSFSGLKVITICAGLSMTATFALAGDGNVSAEQILNALQPKPLTRGLSMGARAAQIDPEVKAKQASFVEGLRNRKTRSLSTSEREQIAEIAATKPNIDLEIQFDFNSASISSASMPSVKALGEALTDAKLKGSTFVVAPATPTASAAIRSTRISPSGAPIPSSNIWSRTTTSTAATSSPSAMARPS